MEKAQGENACSGVSISLPCKLMQLREVVRRNMLLTCVPVLILITEIKIATMASQRISVTGTEIYRLHDDRKRTP